MAFVYREAVPSTRRPVHAPYTLDRAVSDEEEFWRHIGDLIDKAVEKALEKHHLAETLVAMQIVSNSQKVVIQRLNKLDQKIGLASVDVSRLAGWATEKSLRDDHLEAKISRLLEILTPPMPPPTPPEKPTPP